MHVSKITFAVGVTILFIPLKINRLKIKVLMEYSQSTELVLQSSPTLNNRRFYEKQLLFQILNYFHPTQT